MITVSMWLPRLDLEVIRRLSQPTLILAPTITIRDQWIERRLEYFLTAGTPNPNRVFVDLHRPALLTVVTYRHCKHKSNFRAVPANE